MFENDVWATLTYEPGRTDRTPFSKPGNLSLGFPWHDGFRVHAILGIRASPFISGGKADSQNRMDQQDRSIMAKLG